MKKIVLGFVLMFWVGTYSQSNFAVFGGGKASVLTEGIIKSIGDVSIGYQFGALYEHELSKRLSFRPKLSLSMQGDRNVTNPVYNNYGPNFGNIDYKLTYLNTSLDIKYSDATNKRYLLVGPQLGILVDYSKGKYDLGAPAEFDFGLKAGLAFNIGRFFIEFEYYQGLSSVFKFRKIEDLGSGEETTANNATLNLNLGFQL